MYCVLMIIIVHYQESALHKAAQNGHQEVAELLLSFKASIDDKNEVIVNMCFDYSALTPNIIIGW